MDSPREKAKSRLKGICLGLTTPFLEDGGFDEEGFRKNIEFYIQNGIKTFVVGGTMGEVTALSLDERKHVIRAGVEQSAGRAIILADTHHVGNINEVIGLTRYAEEVGADFAYILTPFYWRPTDRALFEWYKTIAQSVKKIGIMLYPNPWRTNVRLKPEVIRELLQFKNIAIVKAADPDVGEITKLVAATRGEIVINIGWEVHALHAEALGISNYFGIVGYFNPEFERRYEQAILNMDRQQLRELHVIQQPLRELYSEIDAPVLIKECLDMVGLRGGHVRLPLWPMTDDQKRKLREVVKDLGTKVLDE